MLWTLLDVCSLPRVKGCRHEAERWLAGVETLPEVGVRMPRSSPRNQIGNFVTYARGRNDHH
jgi:hypothetical protein